MIEPLPNAFSICPRAASSAFCLSMLSFSTRRRAVVIIKAPLFHSGGVPGNDPSKSPGEGPSKNPSKEDSVRRLFSFRSEEHTSELQSLMRISYAVFCLKKKRHTQITTHTRNTQTKLTYHK